jgi:hypothetical protein
MSSPGDTGGGLKATATRRGSFGDTFRAVAWSFFGVRRRADLERDVERLKPVHIIVAGLVGAAMFVVGLIVLIKWIVGSGVAT